MFCSSCGAKLAEGSAFCGACGRPVVGYKIGAPVTESPALAGAAAPAGAAAAGGATGYAGFWLRLVALIIDAIVLGIAGTIITLPFAAALGFRALLMGRGPGFPMRPEDLFALLGTFFWIIVIRSALNWLYYAFFESSAWQATLGKKAVGLYVTDMDGRRIGFGRATGRFFGKIISGLILWIGFIMAGFTEKKQALHDMMAGCLVMRKL